MQSILYNFLTDQLEIPCNVETDNIGRGLRITYREDDTDYEINTWNAEPARFECFPDAQFYYFERVYLVIFGSGDKDEKRVLFGDITNINSILLYFSPKKRKHICKVYFTSTNGMFSCYFFKDIKIHPDYKFGIFYNTAFEKLGFYDLSPGYSIIFDYVLLAGGSISEKLTKRDYLSFGYVCDHQIMGINTKTMLYDGEYFSLFMQRGTIGRTCENYICAFSPISLHTLYIEFIYLDLQTGQRYLCGWLYAPYLLPDVPTFDEMPALCNVVFNWG